jgi:hypothetical protein
MLRKLLLQKSALLVKEQNSAGYTPATVISCTRHVNEIAQHYKSSATQGYVARADGSVVIFNCNFQST